MRQFKIYASVFVAVFIGFLFSACDSARKVPYFKDVTDTLKTSALIPELAFVDPVIQPTDVLQVTLQTIDPKTGDIFLQSGKTATEASLSGYMVDRTGEIELPILGRVHVAGLTLIQTREIIREKAKKYYVDPAVNVRFLNYYINVLGAVGHPGKHNIISEKVSIMDAISMAGDLPLSSRRDNILLIREQDGQKLFVTLNLNSSKIFQSPYFYLHSGDILYISPNKSVARQATADVSRDRYISYSTTLLSLFLTIYTLSRVK